MKCCKVLEIKLTNLKRNNMKEEIQNKPSCLGADHFVNVTNMIQHP